METFDAIVVLTLEGQYERHNHMHDFMKTMSVKPDAYTYFIAKRMQNPKYGSFDSHSQIILNALKAGHKNVMIFEDDVIKSQFYDENVLRECVSFMKTNTDWDFFYFGHCPPDPRVDTKEFFKCIAGTRVTKHIYDCNCQCLHAYAVSRKGMIKYKEIYEKLKNKEFDRNIDVELMKYKNDLNVYMCVPSLFDQDWCLGSVKDLASELCRLNTAIDIPKTYYYSIKYRSIIALLTIFAVVSVGWAIYKLFRV